MKTTDSVENLAEQGTPISGNGPRLDNGKPDLSPTAGYDGHFPVQFGDETDETFAQRVAMFKQSYSSAMNIASGGQTYDGAVAALDARYEAEMAGIDSQKGTGVFKDDKTTNVSKKSK